jgi:hypothetical protein
MPTQVPQPRNSKGQFVEMDFSGAADYLMRKQDEEAARCVYEERREAERKGELQWRLRHPGRNP